MGNPIESTEEFTKRGMDVKNIILICVTRKVIRADLNLKQQFDSLPFRLTLKVVTVQSQSYSSTSKVMRCGKVYFAPLPLSLGHCCCILDTKNMKCNCHMNY